jgi:hypothetical protein
MMCPVPPTSPRTSPIRKAEVIIQTASVDTRSEGRDEHLRSADFFDVETYPEIRFVSSAIDEVDEGSYIVTGELTIRDMTKTVSIPARAHRRRVRSLRQPARRPRGLAPHRPQGLGRNLEYEARFRWRTRQRQDHARVRALPDQERRRGGPRRFVRDHCPGRGLHRGTGARHRGDTGSESRHRSPAGCRTYNRCSGELRSSPCAGDRSDIARGTQSSGVGDPDPGRQRDCPSCTRGPGERGIGWPELRTGRQRRVPSPTAGQASRNSS